MRLRNVAGLALALALFAGTLGWLHERQQPPAQPPASRAWLPGLKPHQVTALCIATPGKPVIHLRRDGKGWKLASRAEYPASGEAIRQLLRTLADARLLEEKSALPENRERMGLADAGKGQASRIILERGDAPPLVLLLGKPSAQGGQLVKRDEDDRAWLIDRTVGLPLGDLALLNRQLTALPFEQLSELSLSYSNGVRLNISRKDERDDGIHLQQFPSKPRLMGEAEAEQAARLFSALTLVDVAPAGKTEPKPLLTFTLKSFSGGSLKGQLFELDRQYWLQLNENKGFAEGQVGALTGWRYRVQGLAPETAPAPSPPKASPLKKSRPEKPKSPKC
ncbi:hypothetical protein AXX04_06015 [Pseudomonas aeruginosa]|uniref:DUF4340 domain-containing protein n=1 Tax=Pseudomonas aeruginosa TaxID=287 RepID=UPI000E69C99B|nr:DUF4340 domain-containing protein [Pseudomonas aeruginosa]RIZ36078.1 hypothetical protein AXX04_06015 [Pseudomonas aeruginosa]